MSLLSAWLVTLLLPVHPGLARAQSQTLDRPPVTKVEALQNAAILSLASDGNTLWAGASGGRLVRIDKADLSLDDKTERFRIQRQDSITDLFVDGDTLWVATNHNTWLAKPFRRTGEPLDPQTAGGFLKRWLSTHDDLARRCGKSSLMTFLDEREFAWLGYFKGSAYRYGKRTGRCTEVFRPPSIYEWPTALAGDAGFVYIGTRGAGLIVVGRDALTAVSLTSAHHSLLARNQVIESLAVDDEWLWLGTAKGLVAIWKSWLAQQVAGPQRTPERGDCEETCQAAVAGACNDLKGDARTRCERVARNRQRACVAECRVGRPPERRSPVR